MLVLSYFCYFFNDFVDEPKLRFLLGWLYCVILLFSVFVNIMILLYDSVWRSVMRKCRKSDRIYEEALQESTVAHKMSLNQSLSPENTLVLAKIKE